VRLHRYLRQHASQGKRRRRIYPSLDAAAEQRAGNGDLSHQAARLLAKRGTEQHGEGVSWRHDPRLTFTSPHYYTEEQVLAVLGAIDVPTALLMAEEGLLQQRPTTAGRCAAVADLQVIRLPGGHHFHMERPAAVADALSGLMIVREQGSRA
jgi:pimeloyl-ACP methyl ester carboxylesterase